MCLYTIFSSTLAVMFIITSCLWGHHLCKRANLALRERRATLKARKVDTLIAAKVAGVSKTKSSCWPRRWCSCCRRTRGAYDLKVHVKSAQDTINDMPKVEVPPPPPLYENMQPVPYHLPTTRRPLPPAPPLSWVAPEVGGPQTLNKVTSVAVVDQVASGSVSTEMVPVGVHASSVQGSPVQTETA